MYLHVNKTNEVFCSKTPDAHFGRKWLPEDYQACARSTVYFCQHSFHVICDVSLVPYEWLIQLELEQIMEELEFIP